MRNEVRNDSGVPTQSGKSRRQVSGKKNEVISKGFEGETRCHEPGCGNPLPKGNGLRAWYCQTIGLCRYCYRHKYPRRGRPKWAPISSGSKRFLSWDERRYMERAGFNPEVWSPEFRAEMEDYWEARKRGEV